MATGGPYASTSPPSDLVPVTKSDATDDPNGPFRGLLLEAAGTIKVTMASGQARTFISGELAAGVIHPMQVLRVWSTGTGAQGIKGAV
jgi:hypothetical protein